MRINLAITFLITFTNTVFSQLPIDSIKAIIKQEVTSRRSKSIIVGIIDANGRKIFSEGIISDKNPVAPDANTIYEIGSITKVFTSLLLAEMSLKNELNLDDPISKFLPDTVKTPVRNGKEISLRNLSTHRSGLSRTAFNLDPANLDNPYGDYSVSQLYEYISNFELMRDIDSRWQYSNIGYALLGNILTIVSHKDLETMVDEEICSPLNMNLTFFTFPPKFNSNIASGYSEYGKPASDWDLLPLAGGGGMRSNVNDMLTFAAANLGFTKSDLLPVMELTHVKQGKKDGNDGYVTLGWTLWNDNGKNIIFKDGGTGGYRTFLGIDKVNKIGVVVLSNTNNIITDIGLHILDTTSKLKPYKYPWNLLDTLRTTINLKGVSVAIELYKKLKASNDSTFIFDENQLNHLGNELRRDKKIKDAIKIYELNLSGYPKSTLACESLGETYKRNNDAKTALIYFEKAKELEPQNLHWSYIINKLKSGR